MYRPKISKGYWRRLVPNFTPIGEVPAEKTVTEQKYKQRNSKLTIPLILRMEEQQVLAIIWEERVANPHCRECTRPLRVLLAAQCPLQTSLVTQPRVRYIHTAVPHSSYTLDLHCII